MICRKCGAPIPAGSTTCPYCGTSHTAVSRKNGVDEETTFAETDPEEFFSDAEDATEYAPVGTASPAPLPEEETDFAPSPTVPTAGAPRPTAETAAPLRKTKKEKKQRTKRKNDKKGRARQDSGGPNQALRLVLLAVLAVLIVLLILR